MTKGDPTFDSLKFQGVWFNFKVNYYPDNGLPEIVVEVDDIGNNMVVFAFDRGGLTLCGDSVHLAVDGDEAYCETLVPQSPESEIPQPRNFEPVYSGVPGPNRYLFVDKEKY